MNLNRWYFYGKVSYGRISEGFLDQKREFQPLEIYLKDILISDFHPETKEKLRKKEVQILNHLSKIFQTNKHSFSSSNNYFLKPIAKNAREKVYPLEREIPIYDLRKSDQAKT
jgi:hypothetical protein